MSSELKKDLLKAYDLSFDRTREDVAFERRGEFLQAFPAKRLAHLGLNDYVIGLKKPTFCSYVEARTRPWANIQGATATKFGIYYGKSGDSPAEKYRFTKKFGETRDSAFANVKDALLSLMRLGKADELDFDAIDENPLSQMFKAKILSLYFPEKFLNVCSAPHLEEIANILGHSEGLRLSHYQHLLLQTKNKNSVTKGWSNPKFMCFLYDNFIYNDTEPSSAVRPPRSKSSRRVDFDEINAQRGKVGKLAEEFALDWEKSRLEGNDWVHLIDDIKDLRDRPGYGYDFRSHSDEKTHRFIEVKSIGKLPNGEGYRFFLSDNELGVSRSEDHADEYYFYLVRFDGTGTPCELIPKRAREFFELAEMKPASYTLRFDL